MKCKKKIKTDLVNQLVLAYVKPEKKGFLNKKAHSIYNKMHCPNHWIIIVEIIMYKIWF